MTFYEILLGDCLKVMKELKPEHYDLILTDPPYAVAQDEKANKSVKKWRGGNIITNEWDKFKSQKEFKKFTQEWMKQAYNLLRPKGWFCVWSGWRNIPLFINTAKKIGLRYNNLFTWAKPDGALSFPRGLSASCEYVIIFYKTPPESSSKKFIKYLNPNNIQRDYTIQPTLRGKERKISNHPTTKPININNKFIKHFTKKGDNILDPFLGSGTTMIGCIQLQRNCTGIEINKEYCETANKRVRTTKTQKKVNAFT